MTFSIIIPVYNVAPYLRECLDSVLTAVDTLARSVEILCVDDGSTDASGAMLEEYAQQVKAGADGAGRGCCSLRVIRQPNQGIGAARNAALAVARGEWVWFVDGDDAIHPEALKFLAAAFRKHPEAAAVCIGDVTGVARPNPWPALDYADSVESSRRDTASYRRFRRAGWAVVFRRSQLGALRFSHLRIGEDVVFCQEFYWAIAHWVETANPLYFYRIREVSAMNARPTVAAVGDYLESCRDLVGLLAKNRGKWCYADMREHLAGKSDSVYHTVRRMLFALSDEELRRLLPRWLALQWQMDKLYRISWRRRVKLWLIALTHSVWLTRLCVELGVFAGVRNRGGS